MTDSLYQMTAEYNPVHDRILFRVSTQKRLEYRVWLTRRIVKSLWGVAIRSFEAEVEAEAFKETAPSTTIPPTKQEPRVKQAVMSMKHQEAVQSSDFSKKHDTKTKPPPEGQRPLLVVKAEIGKTQDGNIRLTLHTLERKNVNLNLNEKTLHAVCHMLQRAADKAGWDLELRVGDAGSVLTGDERVLN